MKLTYISLFSLLVGSSLAIECDHPRYTLVGTQCKEITCRFDSHCTGFKGNCAGKGTVLCNYSEGICGCSKENVASNRNNLNNCNKGHTCLPGELCTIAGDCIKNSICNDHAEICTTDSECCPGFFCHIRLSDYQNRRCYHEAYPAEDCADGIPCTKGFVCDPRLKVCSNATK